MHGESVVIVDYGLGNLFSVQRALNLVGGVEAKISFKKDDIENAASVVLPGVGAFGDGMENLRARGLISTLQEYAESGRPLLGVCLGMQLLFSRSEEFGTHIGLGLIPGNVRRLKSNSQSAFKIPHIGWNTLQKYCQHSETVKLWDKTLLEGLDEGVSMYFNHSFVVEPEDPAVILALTDYGNDQYCSVLRQSNIAAVQFHPELSGEDGLRIYRNFL